MKRLLLIGDTNSIYVHNYAYQLRKHFGPSLRMDIFATFPPKRKAEAMPYDHIFSKIGSESPHPSGKFGSWLRPVRLFRFLKSQQEKFDVVHVLYCIQDLMVVGKPLRKVAPRLILTVFGSDFFQLSNRKRRWFHPVYQSADIITSNNTQALKAIETAFSLNPDRLKICRFGFNALETLYDLRNTPQSSSRERLHLPEGKVIICIGYNYDSIQQHIPILKSIAANADLLLRKDELFFLVPMTYGTEPGYKEKLLQALSQFPFYFLAIEHFLSEEENAHLRKAPDILIQLQKNDSFSASTQEHIYADNLLITGDWLPYSDLRKAGIYYRTIPNTQKIGDELNYCLERLEFEKEKCNRNPEAIYHLSSWNSNLSSWLKLYE